MRVYSGQVCYVVCRKKTSPFKNRAVIITLHSTIRYKEVSYVRFLKGIKCIYNQVHTEMVAFGSCVDRLCTLFGDLSVNFCTCRLNFLERASVMNEAIEM